VIRRADGTTAHGGPHAGSRGTLRSIREGGSGNLPEADAAWEQAVQAAMVTMGDAFGARWHGDWETWDNPDDQVVALAATLWGSAYRRQEQAEPPFGRR
jgi:hypothetical protein